MDKKKQATHSTNTDKFNAIIEKMDTHNTSCAGISWVQLVLALVTIISFILIGVLYIIRAENAPMKKDIEHVKEDIEEIKEACKPIKDEDQLAFFIDGRIELNERRNNHGED